MVRLFTKVLLTEMDQCNKQKCTSLNECDGSVWPLLTLSSHLIQIKKCESFN